MNMMQRRDPLLLFHSTLARRGVESEFIKVSGDTDLDLYDYDLLFLGSPVIAWGPTNTMRDFVMKKLGEYHKTRIQPSAPLRPGKFVVSFCTFSGTHIGENEAIPLKKWFSSFLEHLGCQVMGEWNIVGEFHKTGEPNINGRLGDIRGRPRSLSENERFFARSRKAKILTARIH